MELAGYRLVGRLHEGAYSELHVTDRGSVIKVYSTYLRGVIDAVLAEVERAAALGNPCIVSVEKTRRLEGDMGCGYVVMPRLRGHDLRALLDGRRPPPMDTVLSIAQQMASAFRAAHQAGLRHGMVWPQHIFVGDDGRVTLLDFGAPTERIRAKAEISIRPPVGHIEYLSPEECRGAAVDVRADLYSFGCVLYELVVGWPPFRSTPMREMVEGHLHRAPPPLPAENLLAPLIMALLEKDPGKRPQYDEIAVELDRVCATSGR